MIETMRPIREARRRSMRCQAPLAALDAVIADIRQQSVLHVYERARDHDRSRAPTAERLREELGRLSWTGEKPLRCARIV